MNEIMERTEVLMKNGIVIDTLSHGPLPWDEELVKANDEMLEKGVSAWEIVPELVIKFAQKVVQDDQYYQLYKNAWEQSMVDCVSWTIGPLHSKPYSFEGVFHNYAVMSYIFDLRSDYLVKILRADDIERAVKDHKRGIILNFQSMQHIGEDIDLVELYYMMGVRIMQLTYNTKNLVGTGCTAKRDRGLTDFGKQVVDKINELGAIVDVSHCGMHTSADAVEYSKDPVIASHTFSKELYDHDRGKTDELLKAIAEKNGYIGILAVAGFLTQNPKTTIEEWLDHVDYVVNLVGIDYVGIGTDFYGFSLPQKLAEKITELLDVLGFRPEHKASFATKVEGFEDYPKFPNLVKGLVSRGYTDKDIKKLAGENFLRTFRTIVG